MHSTYGNAALAYIAHAWARLGGATVSLRFDEHTIAAYCMLAPTCQLFAYAKAILAPGAVVLELHIGYQWWIPPRAGIKGWRDEKWGGEVDAVDFNPDIGGAFVRGLFQGLASQNVGGPLPPPRPSYRLASDDIAKTHGITPEGGDSLDLMILLAARPWEGKLHFSHVILKSGQPLFPELDGRLAAMRAGLLSFIHGAVATARERVERAFA